MYKHNMTMLTDFYEFTMANGYFEAGMADDIAYFDMFFRKIPEDGGFARWAEALSGCERLAAAWQGRVAHGREAAIVDDCRFRWNSKVLRL